MPRLVPETAPETSRPEALAEQIGLTHQELQAILDRLSAEPSGDASNSNPWLVDQVLAYACAAGHEGAWHYFVKTYESRLMAMAMRIMRDPSAAGELVADLYGDLFGLRQKASMEMEDGGVSPRLASKFRHYSGRGPLLGWLRALIAQMRINQIRRQKPQISLDDAPLAAHAAAPEYPPEAPLLRQMAEPLDLALAAVLNELPPEDCTLLALYFLDHQTLAAIGELYSVHEATISRRLGRLLRGMRRGLRKELLARNCSLRQIEELMSADVRAIPSRFRSLLRRWSAKQRPRNVEPEADAQNGGQTAPVCLQAPSVTAFSKATTQHPDRRERPAMPFGLSRS